ncbi:Rhomboid family protein [Pirellula staleyi DSM 6068]|uniref:Rhomboid family protein n=1 Tax=Pirellula staleyi (strain ATCC 27377 / DSM 6068 / ICPB 4128) TaxID=530564 RepID=D2R8U2_PIRSD|nr:rhomboid family intramembrane serine protease [Pirellula staleyi]ADB19392.1 Rhomboid family protein [Pirellula staleyi DSM 6068]
MGYQDRDYIRDETPYGGGLANFSATVQLMIVCGVIYLADLLTTSNGKHYISDTLSVNATSFLHPLEWWKFLTAGFVHSARPSHIIGNMIGLYFFGTAIEGRSGRWEFLRFYLLAIVFSSIFWCVTEYYFGNPLSTARGASGGVTAVVILYCLLYPRSTILLMMFIPMPAWLAGILIIGGDVLQLQNQGANIAFTAHIGGALFALAYWSLGINLGRFWPVEKARELLSRVTSSRRNSPDLRIHDPEQYYDDLDAEADRVLEKLHRDGESSLSPRERRVLEDYARRMRQKLR